MVYILVVYLNTILLYIWFTVDVCSCKNCNQRYVPVKLWFLRV